LKQENLTSDEKGNKNGFGRYANFHFSLLVS
jgi:hypothetical protein